MPSGRRSRGARTIGRHEACAILIPTANAQVKKTPHATSDTKPPVIIDCPLVSRDGKEKVSQSIYKVESPKTQIDCATWPTNELPDNVPEQLSCESKATQTNLDRRVGLRHQKNIDLLLAHLHTFHYKTLQALCNSGGRGVFDSFSKDYGIAPRDWFACYSMGVGCQSRMIANIRSMFQQASDSAASGMTASQYATTKARTACLPVFDVAKLRSLLEMLDSRHYSTLQGWCLNDGPPEYKEFTEALKASSVTARWKECYDDSDDCQDIMASEIRKMFEALITQ